MYVRSIKTSSGHFAKNIPDFMNSLFRFSSSYQETLREIGYCPNVLQAIGRSIEPR